MKEATLTGWRKDGWLTLRRGVERIVWVGWDWMLYRPLSPATRHPSLKEALSEAK